MLALMDAIDLVRQRIRYAGTPEGGRILFNVYCHLRATGMVEHPAWEDWFRVEF
jgi:hypothetical protein